MKALIILNFLVFVTMVSNAQTTTNYTIQHNGITRDYRLYVPAMYSVATPVPLVFNLHGYTSDNVAQEFYGDFRPIADTANFIIVHPNGTFDQNGDRWWNAFDIPGVNDVGFISAIIDEVSGNFSIDQNCIYSTGMSNGGFMSYELACALGNRIAAVASVTGTMTNNKLNSCNPVKPTPAMQIHGTLDPTVPYAGNAQYGAIEDVVDFWVNQTGSNTNPQFTAVPNINTTDGCTAEHYVYSGGLNNTSVEFYKIINGAHTWPGAPVSFATTNQDFDASTEIWRFFRQYKLNALLSLDERTEIELTVYPNPSAGSIQITSTGQWDELYLIDMTGRIVQSFDKYVEHMSIDYLDAGIYSLQFKIGQTRVNKKIIVQR